MPNNPKITFNGGKANNLLQNGQPNNISDLVYDLKDMYVLNQKNIL